MEDSQAMMQGETPAERDRRVRGEEARMVRLEERIGAVHELLLDERRGRQTHEESFNKHMQQDDQRFASIDSRLQGFQTQITQLTETALRIEKSLTGADGLNSRIKALEDEERDRSAVSRFLNNTWTHVIGGGGIVLFVVALAKALDLM